jgi:uncharacterized protein
VRLVDGRVVYAASDLNDYLACPHRVALRLEALAAGRSAPDNDPTAEIIARKGEAHERRQLERFVAEGRSVTRIALDEGSPTALMRAVDATREAMRRGDGVIYQAAFLNEDWSGRADFLVRVEVPSALGAWSYEVADTKLALREKPPFLVQLCVYAELVAAVQGTYPPVVRALFGDGSETAYDPMQYLPYVRVAKRRFAAAVAGLRADAVPDRIEACGHCAWTANCDDVRRRADHLSLVASIRRQQIERLRESGIATLAELAAAGDDAAPRGMGSFAKIRRQARLQLEGRTTGNYLYELLDVQQRKGFALLPRPDPHDVYFDMEGDPLYEAGSKLEYLFGAYVRGSSPAYHPEWGDDPRGEKRAFERLIDWLMRHRSEHPNAHVYHYAPYEKSALRRLAMDHATREDEVDDLLRNHVLIDLYAVVLGALVQSQDGYSIKKLEPFYGFTREADVRKGDQSIVAFENYLLERDTPRGAALKADIIRYNKEDCVSTAELHAWLLTLRPADAPWLGDEVPEEERKETERDAERRKLEASLREGTLSGDPRALTADLLAYHRREDKPQYWAFYERIEHDIDFVNDDKEALGGLELSDDPARVPVPEKRSYIYTYTFPPQEFKLGRGPCDQQTQKAVDVWGIDEDRRLIRIKRSEKAEHPMTLIPGRPLRKDAQVGALERFARSVLDGTVSSRYPAAWDVVRRARPRITGLIEGDVVQPETRAGCEAIDPRDIAEIVLRLDESALVVQGPPGTGKTFAGAHIVAELLHARKRVGITSTSHKAINNLLREVERVVAERGENFRGVKKSDADDADTHFDSSFGFITNETANASFAEFQLVAGTAWLFARDDLAPVDVLIIDEAGQVSLADAVAVATNARSVVFLGDPLQLAHVSQGTHPDGAGASVLTHLVGERGTVALDRGVFLDRSFRMHPDIAAFVSAMLYERRLTSVASCALQRVDSAWFSGAGLRFVPAEHVGCSQSSEVEAAVIGGIFDGLLGGTFTDQRGDVHALTVDDILVVTPYNQQVRLLTRRLLERFGDGVRVGTVDKFQGQEAPVVIYSMAASSAEEAPRGADFLFEENRFNVAISRGRALAVMVASPRLLDTACGTVDLLRSVSAFCGFAEAAEANAPSGPGELLLPLFS